MAPSHLSLYRKDRSDSNDSQSSLIREEVKLKMDPLDIRQQPSSTKMLVDTGNTVVKLGVMNDLDQEREHNVVCFDHCLDPSYPDESASTAAPPEDSLLPSPPSPANTRDQRHKISILTRMVESLTLRLEESERRVVLLQQDLRCQNELRRTIAQRDERLAQLYSSGQASLQRVAELEQDCARRDQELTKYRLDSFERDTAGDCFVLRGDREQSSSLLRVPAEDWHALQAQRDTSLLQAGELAIKLAHARAEQDELQEQLQQRNSQFEVLTAQFNKLQEKCQTLEAAQAPRRSLLSWTSKSASSTATENVVTEQIKNSENAKLPTVTEVNDHNEKEDDATTKNQEVAVSSPPVNVPSPPRRSFLLWGSAPTTPAANPDTSNVVTDGSTTPAHTTIPASPAPPTVKIPSPAVMKLALPGAVRRRTVSAEDSLGSPSWWSDHDSCASPQSSVDETILFRNESSESKLFGHESSKSISHDSEDTHESLKVNMLANTIAAATANNDAVTENKVADTSVAAAEATLLNMARKIETLEEEKSKLQEEKTVLSRALKTLQNLAFDVHASSLPPPSTSASRKHIVTQRRPQRHSFADAEEMNILFA